jgi:hypothetical protein
MSCRAQNWSLFPEVLTDVGLDWTACTTDSCAAAALATHRCLPEERSDAPQRGGCSGLQEQTQGEDN